MFAEQYMGKCQHGIVLAYYATKKAGATAAGRYVLVKRDHPKQPYVTWFENLELGGFHHGGYFGTLEEARVDFLQRCALHRD